MKKKKKKKTVIHGDFEEFSKRMNDVFIFGLKGIGSLLCKQIEDDYV